MEYAPAIVLLDPSRADSDDVTAYHQVVNFTISRSAESRCHRRNHHFSARVDSRENANAAESRRVSPYEAFGSPCTGVLESWGTPTKKKRRGRVVFTTVASRDEYACAGRQALSAARTWLHSPPTTSDSWVSWRFRSVTARGSILYFETRWKLQKWTNLLKY